MAVAVERCDRHFGVVASWPVAVFVWLVVVQPDYTVAASLGTQRSDIGGEPHARNSHHIGCHASAKQMNDEWKETVKPLVESADLDDSVRADMLERMEQLEYATVAQGQLERLKERLAGDVADLIADRLKGDEDS